MLVQMRPSNSERAAALVSRKRSHVEPRSGVRSGVAGATWGAGAAGGSFDGRFLHSSATIGETGSRRSVDWNSDRNVRSPAAFGTMAWTGDLAEPGGSAANASAPGGTATLDGMAGAATTLLRAIGSGGDFTDPGAAAAPLARAT